MRYAVNCSLLFTEVPLLERPAAAADAGFTAVEFWWPFATSVPSDAEVDRFVTAVGDAGVQLVGLNVAAGDMPAGDRGLVSWPGRETEFADTVAVIVGIGERTGCRAFNALYGNRLDGVDPQAQDDLGAANLALVAEAVAAIDGTVLLEPVSGAPAYPLCTAADVLAVLDRVGAPNTGLLADLYHLAVNGDDVDAVLAAHADRIAHVQVADAPGRGEPGTGELPLARQLDALADRGYAGWVALEYKPATTTTEGLAWLPREQRAAVQPA
ncbi:hydroxypyruvate isomerase [Klenkia soli]|uniref:Hydroxypyruvate isomerase n=1 Tax=Klenkia soli TaxID=1052260 RepID=A0A1H0F5D8_9ACTN|nr:TIM barrel protein [Klenkia soli]SDN89816.1 hydroxypyruvate isomerase [Klenkia soli]